MLNVFILSVFMLDNVMLNVYMLSFVMLSVVMLIVMAPEVFSSFKHASKKFFNTEPPYSGKQKRSIVILIKIQMLIIMF